MHSTPSLQNNDKLPTTLQIISELEKNLTAFGGTQELCMLPSRELYYIIGLSLESTINRP